MNPLSTKEFPIMQNLTHTAQDTHAIILAAGLGSRLKENTRELPKCLVAVSDTPILARMLDNLQAIGVRRVSIVVGYLDAQIRQFGSAWQSSHPHITLDFVQNPGFAHTGSVFSLSLALHAAAAGTQQQHLLLIEGDVVLDPALLADLLDSGSQADTHAATLLAAYEPSLNGTFATCHNGIVSAWLHESVRNADFDLNSAFKTVNLTFIARGTPRTQLLQEVDAVIHQQGVKAPLEYAMQQLVVNGMPIRAVLTAGRPWFEVDTPEDLEIANAMFCPLPQAA